MKARCPFCGSTMIEYEHGFDCPKNCYSTTMPETVGLPSNYFDEKYAKKYSTEESRKESYANSVYAYTNWRLKELNKGRSK